jgi:hypothetical protein
MSATRMALAGDASSRSIFLFTIVEHDNKRAVDHLEHGRQSQQKATLRVSDSDALA